ncbi:adenylate/guanylate cyclase domain-containing protein [Microvirga thermotolerans]|uniref:2Fe-2S iron-sulfur cluster binding domain-containing protein n=1 Tax=Microvirga thermotolerans TaxID=2651334 RepID=A0A5P9JVM0_9HYPH|nr:adenylate/guanylate cyclase domain-containing protein [Microvirga thermotolerans]QFU15696.1 2Fe-2S iron-sulfur cluster binding domain-containing protein [Microvirga thermotolerans]
MSPSRIPSVAEPRPIGLRELRLASGFVMLAFLVTHFGNHALGLVSIPAMEEGRRIFNLFWRNPLGLLLLYGSLLLHYALALVALYRRRTLRMPAREAAQLLLGLSLPFLLIPHVSGTRLELLVTGRAVGYPDVLRTVWIVAPENAARQTAALLVAWIHGCLGVSFWLRSKSGLRRYGLLLYTGAVLVPVLALLGFVEAGADLAADPGRFPPLPGPDGGERIGSLRTGLYLAFAASIAGTLAARGVRSYRDRRRHLRIAYPGMRVVSIPQGFSVLEASRMGGIPHQAACGGRGRCSTCRIRVVRGLEAQPAPAPQELATLRRIGAPPDVRLACQLRPVQDLSVVPVLSPAEHGTGGRAGRGVTTRGQEREIAVLFCDLREFTQFTEARLPFDTVFLLNRYFEVVGHAVESAGGHLDKFIGDGALALFGLTGPPERAAKQAFTAALRILEGVERLNRHYESELDRPLRVAMGLHAGPAIVGEMGYGQAMGLTAVGDTINAASRLEGLAKDLDAPLVVSADLARRAGLALEGHERQTASVRGRAAPIDAWIVRDAGAFAAETENS